MTNRDILISGGGIAGCALAYRLHRYGFRPTVVERSPESLAGGYAVDLRGGAVDVVDRMGLLPAVRAAATRMGVMHIVDDSGTPVATLPAEAMSGEVEILRGDLTELLHGAIRDRVEYLPGDSVAAVDEYDGGVAVRFEHGPPREFGLVIGPDGLHSRVRSLVFGPESEFLSGLGCYVGICTTPNLLALDHIGLLHTTPGRTVGMYSARDNTEAKLAFFFDSPPLAYDRDDIAGQRRIVAGAFAGGGWQIPRLLAAMADAPDFYFDTISQVRLDPPYRGRTALVGDAAYCPSLMSGMGTSLALLGADALGTALAGASGGYAPALRRYWARLRGPVEGAQALAHRTRAWFLPSATPAG
jgi:2-polyprenyl-6-methoxyphenol hydroxylase-like FAD-dependent oxidoreductase